MSPSLTGADRSRRAPLPVGGARRVRTWLRQNERWLFHGALAVVLLLVLLHWR